MLRATDQRAAVVCIDGGMHSVRTKGNVSPVEQEFYSFRQAGERIGKSAEAVRKYVDRGLLLAKKQGKLRFISKAELDRFAGGIPLAQVRCRA